MWIVFALLSAVFAAATSLLAKVGIQNVNSNLATAIRTGVVLLLSWGIVLITGSLRGIHAISGKSWLFLVLSGIATGLSWLCYYRAIQLGDVARVAAIDKFSIVLTLVMAYFFLQEPLTVKTAIGGLLITAGTLLMVL